jgi:hypothetical protein
MKKVFAFFSVVGILGMLFAGSVYASHNSPIALNDVEGAHNASGWAKVRIAEKDDGSYRTRVTIKVEDLPTESGTIYEGWLVDDDTGYKLSIGAFSTNSDGKGKLKFKQNMVYPALYDKVVVTREPLNDPNPNPDTPVLVGSI